MPELPELPKYTPDFKCPKCGSDKASVQFQASPEIAEEHRRRQRLGWPPAGELIVRGCQVCSFTAIFRPLDFPDA
jgi:hypothetical protein